MAASTTTQNYGGTDTTTQNSLIQYDYNAHDDLTRVIGPDGNATDNSYDAAQLPHADRRPGSNDDITYSYDTCSNGLGRLCKVSSPGSNVFYSYTAFGEIAASEGLRYAYDVRAENPPPLRYPSAHRLATPCTILMPPGSALPRRLAWALRISMLFQANTMI